MKMSEEMAVRLHRMMWSDMQRELGNCPDGNDRIVFKHKWVERNFPGESIANDCWLCEYASSVENRKGGDPYCMHCPIKWPNCHCNTLDFSYAKEPISEILALPAKNESIAKKAANIHDLSRDIVVGEVAKASGLPVERDIWRHIKKIQDKAQDAGFKTAKNELSVLSKIYGDTKMELAKASGLPAADAVTDHIKAIQEKAVDEYFEQTPGAKLATMDVDQAFKQYADEQKAPIFRQLAAASGLSAGNESVKAHISEIKARAKQNGRVERSGEFFLALSVYSGVSKDIWSVHDHAEAIMRNASNEKDMEILRKTGMQLADKLTDYENKLSEESGLPKDKPIGDHIHEIVKNSMEAGAAEERDRIQEKVYEVLLS